MRQHEADRSNDMGRRCQQNLTFGERLTHQPEGEMFEVAQTAVDQLGRG